MLRTFSGLAGALVLVFMGRAMATPANPPHPYVAPEPVVVAAAAVPDNDPSKAPGMPGAAAAAPGQGG